MGKKIILLAVVTAFFSCNERLVYTKYSSLDNGNWKMTDTLRFNFSDLDSLTKYNVFINVRNDDSYQFSNLFLITELDFPNGEAVVDTLEYTMATPEGAWLGKGLGSVKESKLWFRENIVFPVSGVYNFKVSHAMRKNGDVDGILDLKGITDVGLEIEKSTE